MVIRPISFIYADAQHDFKSFHPYRRRPPAQVTPAGNTGVLDAVELSAEAQTLLAASKK